MGERTLINKKCWGGRRSALSALNNTKRMRKSMRAGGMTVIKELKGKFQGEKQYYRKRGGEEIAYEKRKFAVHVGAHLP